MSLLVPPDSLNPQSRLCACATQGLRAGLQATRKLSWPKQGGAPLIHSYPLTCLRMIMSFIIQYKLQDVCSHISD